MPNLGLADVDGDRRLAFREVADVERPEAERPLRDDLHRLALADVEGDQLARDVEVLEADAVWALAERDGQALAGLELPDLLAVDDDLERSAAVVRGTRDVELPALLGLGAQEPILSWMSLIEAALWRVRSMWRAS